MRAGEVGRNGGATEAQMDAQGGLYSNPTTNTWTHQLKTRRRLGINAEWMHLLQNPWT